MAEDGSELAWRLLAALEGGALALLGAALVAHARRPRPTASAAASAAISPCNSVLVTNTENELGMEIKQRLEARGCTVVTSSAMSGAAAGTVDALVVVGADRDTSDIQAISRLVSEDVYDNLKLMETLSRRVRKGGAIAWACAAAGADSGQREGVFRGAGDAFDTALQASLTHTARVVGCAAVWTGRAEGPAQAAERVVGALTDPPSEPPIQGFSIRNAAYKISGYVGRWLKIAS